MILGSHVRKINAFLVDKVSTCSGDKALGGQYSRIGEIVEINLLTLKASGGTFGLTIG
jgi:hypothetical protein